MFAGRHVLWLAVALFGAAILFAALGPEDWQIRLGAHWLVEHALVFAGLTLLVCLAYPHPLRVAMVLVPAAVALEAAQGLTADRTPDIATALVAAGSVAAAALAADLVLRLRR